MGSNVIVLSGSDPRHVRQAFLLIAASAKTQWEIVGESFCVWVRDDTRTLVEQLVDQFQLRIRLPSKKNRKEGTTPQALPIPKRQRFSFNFAPPVSSAILDARETTKRNSASYLGEPIPVEALLEEEKDRKSKKPSDDELRKSLRKLGLKGTARRYGVTPKTIRSWVALVQGARKLIPSAQRKGGSKSNRPPSRILLKDLRELGLKEMARRHGVSPATVRNSWAPKVPGASELIPDGRKTRYEKARAI